METKRSATQQPLIRTLQITIVIVVVWTIIQLVLAGTGETAWQRGFWVFLTTFGVTLTFAVLEWGRFIKPTSGTAKAWFGLYLTVLGIGALVAFI